MSKIYKSNDKTVFIDRFFLSYSDEEKWLNKMASEGLGLVKKSFYRYYFKSDLDFNAKYSVEVLEHPANNPLSEAYIEEKRKNGAELVAFYKCRAYFKMDEETYGYQSILAKKTRVKSVASMFFMYLISYVVSVLMFCYHCVSSLNFTVNVSAEKMNAVTEEFSVFGIFEKLSRLIRLDKLLGDYQSTPVALMFFILSALFAVPTAVYLRELFLLRKGKIEKQIQSEIKK